ncbi:DoxX family protein [Castellaniella sp. MT123]|uniref:DoxX family protein n=1 Tax=Castellaniella sp. MT123 TaxID=3140381 RepID=UPI0031F3F298
MAHSTNSAVADTAPYAALLLRLAIGVMFLAHGLTKLFVFTPAGTAQFFSSVGFPGFLAYPVMAFEIIGGALLILGVLSRWIAALAAIELFVASTVHWGNGWQFAAPNGGGWEYPVFLAVAAAALALLGDGAYAIKSSSRK